MSAMIALYGSPRRAGNTSSLLRRAVEGACAGGAEVQEVFLRDLKMSPCVEIYGCRRTGRCAIQDDFQDLCDRMLAAQGLMLASPIFFYSLSAHTKILIDRCQSLWVRKYWIEKAAAGSRAPTRKGLWISVGATQGKRLFDGARLTVKYFFDVLDVELRKVLLYRGLDGAGDVLKHPEYLEEAFRAGKELAALCAES
jgi:multimeric flavodoxin WrbA